MDRERNIRSIRHTLYFNGVKRKFACAGELYGWNITRALRPRIPEKFVEVGSLKMSVINFNRALAEIVGKRTRRQNVNRRGAKVRE